MGHLTRLMKRPPLTSAIRVAVRDGSRLATQLLCAALARESDFEVIGVAEGAEAEIASTKAHIALIGAGSEPFKTCELVRQLHSMRPDTRAILLFEESTRELVLEAFRSGARGVFSRSEPFESLFKCVTRVHQGQIWVTQNELQFLLEAISEPIPLPLVNAKGDLLLSQREQSVVRCVMEGMTNREIADRLKLSEHTVKNYMFRIFDKLGISSRVELTLYAMSQLHPIQVALPEPAKLAVCPDPLLLTNCPEQLDLRLRQFPPYLLADSYHEGRGVPLDRVNALMWYQVAEELAGEIRANSKMALHRLKATLSPEQVDEAERRAAEWLQPRRGRAIGAAARCS